MRIFTDTEFTSLSNPRLISIGAVGDELFRFYGIVTDYSTRSCTTFVIDNVIPLLDVHPAHVMGSYDIVSHAFSEWIADAISSDGACEIVADDECDIELAKQLIAKSRVRFGETQLRFVLRPITGDALAEQAFRRFFEEAPERRRHNALDDALAYRAALQDAAARSRS